MQELKFRYVYSNGKEVKSFIYTIEEIERIEFWAIAMESKGFKLISRDRFTGLTDKNGVEIFENDIVKDKFNRVAIIKIGICTDMTINGEYSLEYNGAYLDFENNGFLSDISDIEDRYPNDRVEVVGNTHIENLKT